VAHRWSVFHRFCALHSKALCGLGRAAHEIYEKEAIAMTIPSKRLWKDKEGTDEVSEYHATIGNRGICYCFVGNRGTCYCFIVSRRYESPGDLFMRGIP
jgi:hypothetical protein